MSIAIAAFTAAGAALGRQLQEALGAELWVSRRASAESDRSFERAGEWARERFADSEALVFIGATGIAVRSIAGCLVSKLSDPAVVCLDERGCYVISLVSGHIGGANRLARRIADITGGQPVVSTATDVNGLFSVDDWIARSGLVPLNVRAVREFAGALLDGETVGLVSDEPVLGALPKRMELRESGEVGLYIGVYDRRPFTHTVCAVPRAVTLGIGCRRGTPEEKLRAAVDRALAEAGVRPESIAGAASIDLKKDEQGLLELCSHMGIACRFYTAEQLRTVGIGGESLAHSDFVQRITGVDNVCERAALMDGGTLIYPKHALDGVTVALSLKQTPVRLTEDKGEGQK